MTITYVPMTASSNNARVLSPSCNPILVDVDVLVLTTSTSKMEHGLANYAAKQWWDLRPRFYSMLKRDRQRKQDAYPVGSAWAYMPTLEKRREDHQRNLLMVATHEEGKQATLGTVVKILKGIIRYCRNNEVTSIALPAIGCGAGLAWEEVGPIMAEFLDELKDIQVLLYIPASWEQYHKEVVQPDEPVVEEEVVLPIEELVEKEEIDPVVEEEGDPVEVEEMSFYRDFHADIQAVRGVTTN